LATYFFRNLLAKGLYCQAQTAIQSVVPTRDTGRDSLIVLVACCELNLRLSQTKVASQLLETMSGPAVSENAFFKVAHSLLLARTGSMDDLEKLRLLDELLVDTERMSTIYQMCCVLLERAETHLSLANRNEAAKDAKEALATSRRNGYRPLTASGLLLLGLANAAPPDQIPHLEALNEAADIGLPELVAQTCYHLGTIQLKLDHYFIAQEYLLRSTTVTNELITNVPRK
jgi:hypothetical protein